MHIGEKALAVAFSNVFDFAEDEVGLRSHIRGYHT